MANYTIIGGDGKQYGPITDADMRKWFGEGRLNAQTMVKSESDAEFRPLAAFPEFADLFAPTPISPLPFGAANGGREEAFRLIKAPAIALIVTSSIDLFFGFIGMLRQQATLDMYSKMPQFNDPQMQQMLHMVSGPVGIVTCLLQLAAAVVVLIAAIRMLTLKNYGLAITGAVISVIPCVTPCCGLLTLPFGIWALVALNKREVKNHFN